MDYQTKPISRADVRKLSGYFRRLFGIANEGPFPVLEVLDHLSDIFPGSNYVILEDNELPPKTMALCSQNCYEGFTIAIRESVYMGAYNNQTGAFRGFICHEICHLFLFTIGFTPIVTRSFKDGEIPAYCSVEWQAKALCGEVMIPYDDSKGMSVNEIMETYKVSHAFAEFRCKQERYEYYVQQLTKVL